MLWIAFRIQYLWYQQQPLVIYLHWHYCCELLSEFSIFDTNNNPIDFSCKIVNVVNCFQNSVSLIPTTTTNLLSSMGEVLWIAFRIQYLWYQQQPWNPRLLLPFVVNCFQNSVSLIPTTTEAHDRYMEKRLWIAFRIQYLWYQQQLLFWCIRPTCRCELLSEFSIFDTNNNSQAYSF